MPIPLMRASSLSSTVAPSSSLAASIAAGSITPRADSRASSFTPTRRSTCDGSSSVGSSSSSYSHSTVATPAAAIQQKKQHPTIPPASAPFQLHEAVHAPSSSSVVVNVSSGNGSPTVSFAAVPVVLAVTRREQVGQEGVVKAAVLPEPDHAQRGGGGSGDGDDDERLCELRRWL